MDMGASNLKEAEKVLGEPFKQQTPPQVAYDI